MPSTKSNPKPKPEQAVSQLVHEWEFEAIGTHWWIGIYQHCNTAKLAEIQQSVSQLIEQFDTTYSRFRSDSLVTAISKQTGNYRFPATADTLFSLYRKLHETTNGAVTPLVGRLLADAGYDAQYSLIPTQLREVPTWDSVMVYHDHVLTTKQPVLLDFGAAGKGYLVDLVAKKLQKAGVKKYCVDGSGDMTCSGLDKRLRIGLEHPDDTSQVIGVTELCEGALCGSAGNRRTWANFTHIIDPKTLRSPGHLKAVWAYADTALVADALTTALYFADPAKLHNVFNFEHCMMYTDGTINVSSGFPAQLFTKDKA